MFVCALFPPLHPRHCMFCVVVFVCPCQTVYVLGEGGVHMRMHVSSVLVAMSVYAMHPPPPTHVDYLFFVLYLLYHSTLERFVFWRDIFLARTSRLEVLA